jgi:hypothetical protein
LIHTYIENILLRLSISPVIQSFKILKQREAGDEGYIRIKCFLTNGDVLEFSEYLIVENNLLKLKTYNFHWQKSDGTLIMRWDNVEHHQEIKTFPDHIHIGEEKVSDSEPMNFNKVIVLIEQKLYHVAKEQK